MQYQFQLSYFCVFLPSSVRCSALAVRLCCCSAHRSIGRVRSAYSARPNHKRCVEKTYCFSFNSLIYGPQMAEPQVGPPPERARTKTRSFVEQQSPLRVQLRYVRISVGRVAPMWWDVVTIKTPQYHYLDVWNIAIEKWRSDRKIVYSSPKTANDENDPVNGSPFLTERYSGFSLVVDEWRVRNRPSMCYLLSVRFNRMRFETVLWEPI